MTINPDDLDPVSCQAIVAMLANHVNKLVPKHSMILTAGEYNQMSKELLTSLEELLVDKGRLLAGIQKVIDEEVDPGMNLGIEMSSCRSTRDGTVELRIDTTWANLPENEHGVKLRVVINDDYENPIYNNPLETGDEHYCNEEVVEG